MKIGPKERAHFKREIQLKLRRLAWLKAKGLAGWHPGPERTRPDPMGVPKRAKGTL